MNLSRVELIKQELRAHLPFTLVGVITGIGLIGVIYLTLIKLGRLDEIQTLHNTFHLFHYSHILLSALATTALFCRHETKMFRIIWVGYVTTILFCATSDVLIPFLGGIVLGVDMHFHICLIEEPLLVLSSNTLGIALGLFLAKRTDKVSRFSHGGHVLISSFASVFYLISYGFHFESGSLFAIFLIGSFAVIIPCCSGDIIMPISFIGGVHGHEHEDEHTH